MYNAYITFNGHSSQCCIQVSRQEAIEWAKAKREELGNAKGYKLKLVPVEKQILEAATLEYFQANVPTLGKTQWECLDCFGKQDTLSRTGCCNGCGSQAVAVVTNTNHHERYDRTMAASA